MDFPIYRKYSNNQSFFIIHSQKLWTEFKKIGNTYQKFDFTATQFPEQLFINDLIQKIDGVEESSKLELDNLLIC